ncbi:MAG TPA: hypothetical protein VK025_14435 [Steroidobacter sp.]|nr:hypothetical protein [Steroidobacteraceae bacterium]HLS82594.1 hypothetical protein [Steroidobacter sp.]
MKGAAPFAAGEAANEPSVDIPGATAHWTPQQQMAHMLALCDAQVAAAVADADEAVAALIATFTHLGESTRELGAIAAGGASSQAQSIVRMCRQVAEMSNDMAQAVVAFQFYDKLSQRLGHVRYSLSTLAQFVCDESQAGERDQWRKLFTTLRRLYRTDEERRVFEETMARACGASCEALVSDAEEETAPAQRAAGADIELF